MKYIQDFLFELKQKNIELWAEDGQLRFKAPKGALTESLRAELGARKSEILEFLHRKALLEQPIPRLAEGEKIPLSFAQQRLLFLEQLEEQRAVYNMPAVFHCAGQLDENALQASLAALIQRHASLRTCFPSVNGEATAQVGEVYNPLHITDLSALDEAARQAEVDRLIVEHAQLDFDLQHGPLFDLLLLKRGEGQPLLLFNMHHIITDGWSISVFIREWKALYNAYLQGQEAALPELPIQYGDYAAWQRQWLAQGLFAGQLEYWKNQLAGLPDLLELPTDFPRPALMGTEGNHCRVTIPAELAQKIKQLSRDQGATLFMTLLAAFNALLYRYSRQEDFAVGSPIANRTHPQSEGLIGFFVNALVLRAQLSAGQSFLELLQQTRQTALDAYSHQDIPFDYLVEQLNPTRNMRHAPLFQVMFALQNTPQEDLELGGVKLALQQPDYHIAKFDLSLSVTEQAEGLQCDWEYRADLFRPETITRMTGHFQRLLEEIAANPARPISRLPWLTEANAQQLTAWNQTQMAYPAAKTVVNLFEAQAAQNPGKTALVFVGQQLGYAELNQRANQLAYQLIELGVEPDTLVGICVERSLDMITGLLGILKAGGAYVPLDPDYPQERLAFMIEDAGVEVLVTQSHLLARLPKQTTASVCLDQADLDAYPNTNPPRRASPGHLAYIIYTSGSTGKPKGVMIEHAALAAYVHTAIATYGLQAQDRVLQFSSINFDVSVEEIYPILIQGGCLVVRDNAMLNTDKEFLQACDRQAISVIMLPTAYWQQLIHSQGQWPAGLRTLIIGGEAAAVEQVRYWLRELRPTARLFNAYGPTETTVSSVCYRFGSDIEEVCPIGQPLPNQRVYLLDAQLQPVPPGVPGELCIAGTGLARGYLNRPDLTAEKFIELELFRKTERIYKTGDLARWLPDGNLEYLGRIDQQVKLRGFRIELGEIEAALNAHPVVIESAVVLREREGDKILAAYVTAASEKQAATQHSPLATTLRDWLKTRLPDYMIPASFTVLDKLPLTSNGKIDRKALPAPEMQSRDTTRLIKPKTALEQKIAAVWRKVLKLEQVGIQDNFFDLGGHSLLLLQVLSQLQETLNLSLPLVTLFQYPTIQSLAAHLASDKATAPILGADTAQRDNPPNDHADDIAIIGMAGRFPGAADIDAFWENLRNGVESIQFFSDEELLASGIDPQVFNHPHYVRAGGVIEQPEFFDAAFFGFPPSEAELLDPQQRLFMETAWTAIEHAGYDVNRMPFAVGIFAGAGASSYFLNNLWPNQALLARFGQQQVLMSGDKDFLAARVAYKLNLRGPVVSLNTACSTSLVAVHMARQSLLQNECRMALAGGVSVFFPHKQGYLYQEGNILSPDGHCRAFDADAKGTVGGAGVAIVVLKRLCHAQEDGDAIHAIIKGSAINNDGMARMGFTAPSVTGQSQVIRDAMRGLDYESISYIETHGTGTLLGDPIEVSALQQAYKAGTNKTGYCALGAVKTNIGHLDTAAGVAGLIKVVLALKHREIPPTLHFKSPNPQIDFTNSPFFVNTELKPWQADAPRRAGVSSFGIGGTNAHLVLEEAPAQESSASRAWQLLCLSAKSDTALRQYRSDLADYLVSLPDLKLADAAYTCHSGRGAFAYRGFVVGRDASEMAAQLRQEKSSRWQQGRVGEQEAKVAFMFPGQGTQYIKMTENLYQNELKYRVTIDECAELLIPHLQLDIREALFNPDSRQDIHQTTWTQPALFTVEYALAQLWIQWGVQPAAFIGHSIGEYVAACLSGVFSLQDALALVAFRGRLIQSLPAGEMLAVPLSEPQAQMWCSEAISLAAINHPKQCVLSGLPSAIAQLQVALQEQGIESKRLQTSHAFHSHLLEPVLATFFDRLQRIQFQKPKFPYLSNLTGDWINPEAVTHPHYWVQHLRHTVRFADNLENLFASGVDVLLEVGPGHSLSKLARRYPAYPADCMALQTLPPATDVLEEIHHLQETVGRCWLRGINLDWQAFYADEQRLRLPLPTYPFERQRYWIEPIASNPLANANMPASTQETAATVDARCAGETGLVPSVPDDNAPSTETERKVAAIWQLLLGVTPGRDDDFFTLGGDSLLSVQVLSRLRESFEVEISLNLLFERPALKDLANWLDSHHGAAPARLSPILPQPADAPLVMSFAQQRLRFLAQLEGESATYNLPGVVHLAGRLNESALRKAFTALIQRHDSLRLSFPVINGEARVCKGDVYDPVDIEDISKLPAAEQQEISKAWLARHAQTPFNLDSGPLLRLNVLRLNAEEQIALINVHHIISDGWTIGLLIHEWSQCYNAYAQNRQPDLPALPIQYTDYAAWQRQWLQGEVLERQLGYWKQKLADAPALLELPTDYPRPAIMRYQGSYLRLAVDSALTQQIKQFSQDQGVTIFMTLLAAFKVLLYRYSGQQDLQVGTPIAGRTRRETEGLIGFFVNTLVLRSVIAGEKSFLHLLQQVKQTELEAHEHQDIPFEYLVEKLNPARSLSHSPLFQVMFALQNAPEYALQLDGLQARLLESEASTSKFDLTLSIEERGQGFTCHWEYNTDLFRTATIARMHEHWQVLLRGILADPRRQIAHLPLLTPEEIYQLQAWNDTAVDYPKDKTIVDLFEEQVEQTPDNIAVVFEGKLLSYRELNQKANQIAYHLLNLKNNSDHSPLATNPLIAICVERSLEMVIGLLGILKSGGAYVPIDPNYPTTRIEYLLKDSAAPLLLTQSHLKAQLPELSQDCAVICLDETKFAGQSTANPGVKLKSTDLVYVIYTSGSTGMPKGVMIEHRNVINHLHGFEQQAPHVKPLSSIFTVPFSFDLSVWEIFNPLCYGGTLHLLSKDRLLEIGALATYLTDNQISTAYLPPALLESVAKHLQQHGNPLQRLLVGVEPIPQKTLQAFRDIADELYIINGYGPTEATVCATFYSFTHATDGERRTPIGRPPANYRIYILDAQHQPQPLGIPGELCIAGAGLARGYLNRPELTAEKFIEIELFGQTERIYKTGDLARWLPDGNLEYLGRIDHQIKLRGFRIELGEIESVLAQHEAVKEVVVTLYEADGNKRLVAYVVESGQNPLPILQLRDWLKTRLPDYMIPAHFVVLDKLPLTPNGKIDRKALPAPERESETGVLPLTPSEELLAALWSAVLTVETIHRHANFFELGGHSLLATQLVSRVREAFQTELPVRQLFETPVLSDLAAWLDQQQRGEILPPLQPLPEFAPLRLSAAQERLWFLAKLEGPSATYNIPAAVRLHGKLDIDALRQTFALLTERHQSLRMYFPDIDGQSTLKLLPAYDSLQITDLSSLAEDQQAAELQSEILRHGATPFDLATGPLLRNELLILGPGEHVLLFNMHHIISDGWSMAILLRESAAIYKAIAAGQPPVLKPLTAQYADYAAWQRAVLTGDTLFRRIAWWKEYLAGILPLLELPTDHPRPAKQSFQGATLQSGIGTELTRRLQELAQQQGCTLFMTLLAAFSVLLQRHSGQSDIVIGSPIANRAHSQTEDIIGFFVNVLALRTRIDPEQSFTGLLRQTRHSCLGAYAHQDTPFETLVEQLQPTRSLGHSPLFQVMLALQNNASEAFELSGLTVTPLPVDYPMAKFDLTLTVEEKGGQLQCHWEYATDLFQAETIERMAGHFAVLLRGIVDNPGQSIGRLPLLTEAELQQLAAWNDTKADFPSDQTLVSLFEASVNATPDGIAVVFEGQSLTYRQLNERVNRLAHHLRELSAISQPRRAADNLIALCVKRSLDMVVGLLAILKAGGAYVPMADDWPLERMKYILSTQKIRHVLTQYEFLPGLQTLQWELPELKNIVCLDIETADIPLEAMDTGIVQSLWDSVAERAVDDSSAAGFISSYTGETFSATQIDEYSQGILQHVSPYLKPDARLLEIGCGSGLLMFAIAPNVGLYVGLDPSGLTQQRNRARVLEHGHANIELITGFAHELERIPQGPFDLILMASTTQFFPGYRYLRATLAAALDKLAPGGVLVIADVMDPRQKDAFRQSLDDFKKALPAGQTARIKTSLDSEFYIDENFFQALPLMQNSVAEVSVIKRESGYTSELRYRYDVLVQKKTNEVVPTSQVAELPKQVWTNWHVSQRPVENPAPVLTPDDLAYIIYTSGSTGTPKGVEMRHQPVVNLIDWVNKTFNVSCNDRLLFVTSYCFDLSVYDVFGILACGGSVHIASKTALREPQRLLRLLSDERITFWDSAPAALQQLVAYQGNTPIPSNDLRLVFLSGDWIPVSLPDTIRAIYPNAKVIGLGGATEAAIWSNYYPIGEVDPNWNSIPYGKPIQNARYYVLDSQLNQCPIGVPGFLYIGGDCLASGYANEPEQTATKFIPSPFSEEPGARIYYTGDLARWMPDGNMEFLGRIDNQVKLRGFRIELGEIETVLTRHDAVKEAIVTVHQREGEKSLVAYLLKEEYVTDQAALFGELQLHLKIQLPEYMIPAHFMVVEHIPLTSNGKVDRNSLPAPEAIQSVGGQVPANPTEELLAAIWADVLKRDAIYRDDHFFELGGHSLLAAQLVSRIRDGFKIELPVRTIFESPRLSQLAADIQAVRREVDMPSILRQAVDAPKVLSFAQQRLWFLAHLEGQNAAYNMPFALKLHGQLAAAALHQATTALIQRHECLRLCFLEVDGIGTVERIASYDPFNVIDLSALSDAERARQVNDQLARHGKDAFDLTSGPLFSLHLLRLGEQEHVLLCNMHHIISDGWSMGVMVRDWSELYRAATEQREPVLPELSIQYTDYAAWQKDWLRGETLKAQLSYWRDKLTGAPELLDLPTDFPRPAVKTYQGQHLQSTLPVDLVDDIKRVSHEHGATVFMGLLSAFNVLLYRYSRQTDVLVGSPIANRTQRQTEDLIGFFVNTLVLRSQLDSQQTFVELLQQVRQTALGAYSHQDIPFEFLVEQLNPARSTSYSPLFQVMFILQNTPMEALAFGDIKVEILEPELTTAKFDLTLSMTEVGGGFICDWEYSTDLFEADTILRMAGHFETLLRELMRVPEQAVSAFSLLSPAEAGELQRWNATAFEYPRHQTMVDLFEAQAALHPDKIAVRCASAELSFAELNAQANQLAAYLRGLGVGQDTLVGICVERSLEMLVGLLGILKAGGAYVPMDLDYPRERLRVMLDDSAIQVLLTQQRLINHLPESGLTLLCLDRGWPAISAHSTANPDRSSSPNHPAYVIFTSGSTGRPKGVMIEHGALLNFLTYMRQRIGIRESDRFLALTTLSFDIAGLELYLPLISGSQVVIIPRETAMDGERLMQAMDEQRITIMQATPATWKLLLQSGWQQRAPLTILCGGESMPGELGKKLLENSQQLWNVYGPTETTIWSTMQDCTRQPERPELIGRPIGNTQIYILDEHGCVVPPGMSGELCIGGDGLARGYLNRPELTAEKFVEMDLFGQRQTLYKTGDLARLLRNGHLECLGRIDHQVKLRGFRIELGEIEEALNRHPRLQEAAVISNQAKDSLLAYVVPRSVADADSHDQSTQAEQVKRWEQVWSDAYSQSSAEIKDTQRNTIGWNSSYTLAPIPEAEMQEWLDCTIEQILALAPTRILEIGCGTGMLLFRLAPHCEHYAGVDISPAALRWIEQQTQGWAFADRVTLRQAAADQISGIEPGSVDLVIINSVIQYFPSVDYLIRVLRQATEWVAPGGQIFVGDARNFQLLEAFHASIQWFQAEAELTATQLRQRISASLKRERELLIDPEFFSALQQELSAISQARILLKNGVADNEMTRFRYDAVLSISAAAQAPGQAVRKLDWSQDTLTLDKLSQMLADHCADILEISGIPNARLATEQRLLARLEHFEGTVAGLKEEMADGKDGAWVAPESLRALARDKSYACTLHYGDRFRYTAALQRVTPELPPYFVTVKAASTPRPWRSYANEPAVDMLDKTAFAAELRDYLQQQLPAYMVPSSFTVLDKLPLTPNGKINRKALPEPDAQRRGNAYQPPRDTVELQLAQIWEELLKTHPVGISDNFFDIGGHSLLAVRLVAQIEQKFNQHISLSTLFHHGTIEDIAKILRQQSERRPWSCVVPIQPAGKNEPLFCVHPAGGNVLCYLELAQQLGANQPLYAFQAYGLEAEQTPYSEVAEMAQIYITAMKTVQPHGPYQIVGWSFGGPVAVEMATQLQAHHESVTFLGLFDAIAPHIVRDIVQEPEDDAQFFADYFAEADAELSLDYLRQLRPEDQIAYVIAQGRQAGIFPADVDLMQTRRLVNVYRTNMSALLRYRACAYHGRITLFQASERRPEDPALPPEHGWQTYTAQPVEVIQVPGKHHAMMNLPHVQALAQRLKSCLERKATPAGAVASVDIGIEQTEAAPA